jgi:hypothetical protein
MEVIPVFAISSQWLYLFINGYTYLPDSAEHHWTLDNTATQRLHQVMWTLRHNMEYNRNLKAVRLRIRLSTAHTIRNNGRQLSTDAQDHDNVVAG